MSSSRLKDQAMDGNKITSTSGYFVKAIKGFLAVTKAIISGTQTFFGTQYSLSYSFNTKKIFLKGIVATSSIFATNSVISVGSTRSREMLLPSEPKKLIRVISPPEAVLDTGPNEKLCYCDIPPELVNLNFINKAIYCLIIFLSKGSRLFSSLAAYNGAINLCETIVALISSSDDPLEIINQDPVKQSLIQIFGLICFSAQMLSFSMFQSATLKEYLITWWFNKDKRNREVMSQGYLNILLLLNFFITITSTTFFGIFSTESALNNLNKTFFKSILEIEIPTCIMDSLVSLSTVSLVSLTTANLIPATYHFLINRDERSRKKTLTTTGNLLLFSGTLDSLASSYSTIFSSIMRMSKIFNIDPYNPYLRVNTILLVGSTSFFYYLVYNTRLGIERFYSLDENIDNLETKLIINDSKSEIDEYGAPKSPYSPGGPCLYSPSMIINADDVLSQEDSHLDNEFSRISL